MTTTAAVRPKEEKSWFEEAVYEDNRRKQLDYFAWKRRLFYRVIRLLLMLLGICCIVQNYAWIYQYNSGTATTASGGSIFRPTTAASATPDPTAEDCRTGEKSERLDHTSASSPAGIHSGPRSTGYPDRDDTCNRVSEIFPSARDGGKSDEM